jgi:hypothetical protein
MDCLLEKPGFIAGLFLCLQRMRLRPFPPRHRSRNTPLTNTRTARSMASAVLSSALLAIAINTPAMAEGGNAPVATDVIHCAGVNTCRGKGQCKGATNACKGQNACKGRGWITMAPSTCMASGGKVLTS